MKNDQIVRVVAIGAYVTSLGVFYGLNGSGPVMVPFFGATSPFGLVVILSMVTAFPELLDRLPMGPTRQEKSDDN